MNDVDQMGKYYGKFRGQVRNNIDPLGRGRILADVPSLSGMMPSWCMPCVPWCCQTGLKGPDIQPAALLHCRLPITSANVDREVVEKALVER